jgi:hypothetical protein
MSSQEFQFSIYNESDLHHQLKQHFATDGALFEHTIDGYVIDLYQNNQLFEIQTGNFSSIKKKLAILIESHQVNLIHPIIQNKTIRKISSDGVVISQRKSPRHGTIYDLFKQAIYIPHLLLHPSLNIITQTIDLTETWCDDGQGSWRRKHFSIQNKHITSFAHTSTLNNAQDYLNLLPFPPSQTFTNKQLAQSLKLDQRIIQKFTYTLRAVNLLEVVGKEGRALLFSQRRV